MTKAEEAALKAYPVDMQPVVYQDLIELFGGKTEVDTNTYSRSLFQKGYEAAEKDLINAARVSSGLDGFYYGKGYEQAEKDLALTWEDIKEIQHLLDVVWSEQDITAPIDEDSSIYPEVLKRFKEEKK